MTSPMRKQAGFSIVELMIALTLGLILTGGIIQVMVSNSVTDRLNRALASVQEGGRFIISRMRSEVLMAGRYDSLDPALNRNTDIVSEAAFIQNHPIPLPGDFPTNLALGALQGVAGANDELVISMQSERDCRGFKLGYNDDEEFFVVNHYFVDGTQLKCRGYDGRVLLGQKAAAPGETGSAFTLLDDVESLQVLYGVSNRAAAGDDSARPVQYVTANQLGGEINRGGQVVSVRIALLLKSDAEVVIEPVPTFKLLNEAPVNPAGNRLFKQFETTVTLRNVKNFVRNRKV